MKEMMTYVAVDADDVGESIGNAVLSNDTDKISSLSQNINAGVAVFSKWAEYNGGKIISSGSDEGIFQVPITSIGELEELKNKYQEQTGFSISIGIGEKVSDAAKALIYAKMNGKNQIIDYSSSMEEAMKQSISGELSENVEEMDDEEKRKLEGETGKVIMDADEVVDEHEELVDTLESPSHEDDLEEAKDQSGELEEYKEIEEEAEEEVEEESEGEIGEAFGESLREASEVLKETNEEESAIDEEEEFNEEETIEDESLEEMVDSDNPADEDIDLDGQADMQEEHGEIMPNDDLNNDGDVEHEEAMEAEGEYTDEDELSDSIESEMGDEEMPMEEEMSEEMPMEEEMMPEEGMEEDEVIDEETLKDVIFESLQSFKANREHLEMMAQETPELYNALISTLQAMIEMAKELGYGDMAEESMAMDEEAAMAEEGMAEEDVAMEEDEEEMNPDDYAVSEEEEGMEEEGDPEEEEEFEDFEKNEKFTRLIHKMSKAVEYFNMKKEEGEDLEEMKERVKKKFEAKKKVGKGKKRKPSVKKPSVPGQKDKKKAKESNDGSFCAKSHKKMRASGKDCRANEDKDSPLCSARRKFSCRGKNEEKNKKMDKAEESKKLKSFLEKNRKK